MKSYRCKLLIVDCHEDVLITFERMLEDEGYDTTTAWAGQDALRAARNTVFDLVLVNEYLPDMNAEEFIAELRRGKTLAPCIVMQPSAVQITNTAQFVAAGAATVVCKWSHVKVLEAVHAHFASSVATRSQYQHASS